MSISPLTKENIYYGTSFAQLRAGARVAAQAGFEWTWTYTAIVFGLFILIAVGLWFMSKRSKTLQKSRSGVDYKFHVEIHELPKLPVAPGPFAIKLSGDETNPTTCFDCSGKWNIVHSVSIPGSELTYTLVDEIDGELGVYTVDIEQEILRANYPKRVQHTLTGQSGSIVLIVSYSAPGSSRDSLCIPDAPRPYQRTETEDFLSREDEPLLAQPKCEIDPEVMDDLREACERAVSSESFVQKQQDSWSPQESQQHFSPRTTLEFSPISYPSPSSERERMLKHMESNGSSNSDSKRPAFIDPSTAFLPKIHELLLKFPEGERLAKIKAVKSTCVGPWEEALQSLDLLELNLLYKDLKVEQNVKFGSTVTISIESTEYPISTYDELLKFNSIDVSASGTPRAAQGVIEENVPTPVVYPDTSAGAFDLL